MPNDTQAIQQQGGKVSFPQETNRSKIKQGKSVGLLEKKEKERFWSYVERRNSEECWFWKGCKNSRGYGTMNIHGHREGAHRVSYAIHNARPIGGRWVLHKCDTPCCVNPQHLFLGTPRLNSRDMVSKGRHGSRSKPDGICHGERNGRAKLNAVSVKQIRSLHSDANISLKCLAGKFSVSDTEIGRIVHGTAWTHLKQ